MANSGDYACDKGAFIDNRALGVLCYHPGYTLVEKLQAISTKYRKQQSDQAFPPNFMRHYYDVFALLDIKQVQDFVGTKSYLKHKDERFRSVDNPNIGKNEAFLLTDLGTRKLYEDAYKRSAVLYYGKQPKFSQILERVAKWALRL